MCEGKRRCERRDMRMTVCACAMERQISRDLDKVRVRERERERERERDLKIMLLKVMLCKVMLWKILKVMLFTTIKTIMIVSSHRNSPKSEYHNHQCHTCYHHNYYQ